MKVRVQRFTHPHSQHQSMYTQTVEIDPANIDVSRCVNVPSTYIPETLVEIRFKDQSPSIYVLKSHYEKILRLYNERQERDKMGKH